MFGKRKAPATAHLPVIIVRQSALDSEDVYELPYAVVQYVNYVLQEAMFLRSEIPQEAMWAFHVDYYIAQVNNGGHSQYVGNSGWHDYQIADIRAGLKAIGQEDAIELYEDLCAFADSHPEQFQDGMDARGFGQFPEFFSKADTLFYAGINDRLMQGNRDFVASLDCIMPVADDEIQGIMEGLGARNPHYDQRKKEREDAAAESRRKDPIMQACVYLGMMADEPMNVDRWLSGAPTEGPEGQKGTMFQVALADGGVTRAFLFPTFGVMLKPGTEDQGTPLPIDMIQEHVKSMTGDYLPREMWR
ncbi:MAG: DUF4375 domain-containing protein [Pseudomonadota bacterium]